MPADFNTFGSLFNQDRRHTGALSGASGQSLGSLAKELGEYVANSAQGNPAVAGLLLAVIPVTTNSITLTGVTPVLATDKYEFVTAGGNVAANANIGVPLGATAAITAANLALAVNGRKTATGLFKTDGVTPALTGGTLRLRCDIVTSPLTALFKTADAPGGNVVGGDPDILLAEAITDAGDVWLCGNVNMNTLGGSDTTRQYVGTQSLTVTTAMLTLKQRVSFPFSVTAFTATLRTAAGVNKVWVNDLLTIEASPGNDSSVLISLVGGAAGDAANTDIYTVTAYGT